MKKPNYLPFATWLRAASAIMILMCHCCIQCKMPIVAALAHVFNIGVPLFFILSGFLAGYLGIKGSFLTWYIKRFKRIFISFWLFLIFLSIIHLIRGYKAATLEWLMMVVGLQGSAIGVPGAEHTWFLSVLLLCYLFTPMILRLSDWMRQQKSRALLVVSAGTLLVLPIGYALFEQAWVSTIFTPVSIYVFACIWGQCYSLDQANSLKKTLVAVMIVGISLGLRFVAKSYIDGTIWYDRVVVQYTHAVAAFSLLYIFTALFRDSAVPGIIRLISDISFEIYLYHYVFTVGVVPVFGTTTFWVQDCVIIAVITFVIAWVMNRVGTIIHRFINVYDMRENK